MRKSGDDDRRTKYTKKVIHEAYCGLLAKKPYEKITVKEICEIADINRSTFYLHYADSASVMTEIEDALIDMMMQKVIEGYQNGASNYELTLLFTDLFLQNRKGDFLGKVTFGVYGTGKIQEKMQKRFVEFFAPRIAERSDISEREAFLILNYLSGGLIPFTKHWYENDFQNVAEEFPVLDKLIRASFSTFGIDVHDFSVSQ